MADTRIELNGKGIIELFKSPEVGAWLDEIGASVANAAGPEYTYQTFNAGFEKLCNVYPDSREAARDNLKNNTLVKAVGVVGLPTTKTHI